MSYLAAKIGLDLPQDNYFVKMAVQPDQVTNPIALLPAILKLSSSPLLRLKEQFQAETPVISASLH
jgi:hypothetical protein